MAWSDWDQRTRDHWHYGGPAATVDALVTERDQLRAERDEAWAVAREILAELGYPHRIAQFEQEHPWLKEEPGSP